MRSRAWALFLLAAAGCSRCGKPAASSAEELLPAHPAGALVTAPLGPLAQHLAALGDRLASLPGGEQTADVRRGLAAQLGFDPLTPEGLASAGLDPQRGMALAILEGQPGPGWIAALPVAKPDLFLQTAQRLAERAGFAPDPAQQKDARIYQRGGQKLGAGVVRGYGILARTAEPAASIADAGSRRAEETLARDPGLEAARKRLGGQDVIAWAPAGSGLPRRYSGRPLPGDVALSLQGAAQGAALRLFVQLPAAEAGRAQATLPGGGASLIDLLPAEAPLRGRLGIDPAQLLATLRGNAQIAPILARLHGADAEAFASIAPGVALSLGLAKGANIGQAIDYGLDFRSRSPFDTVQLVALAQVRDRPRLLRALQQIAEAAPQLGARVERSGEDFQLTYSGGKGARFGVHKAEGKELAYLMGGPLRPDELRREPRPADPEAAALYQDAGAAMRVDFGKLAASFAALPESAYGSGPQAYVSRSFVAQIIQPLHPVRLTIAAEAFPDRVGATLDLEIAGR